MKKIYGLTGWPLGHSFSASYFNNKFEKDSIDAHYNIYPLQNIKDILKIIESTPELVGFNVTAPYKRDIIPLLHAITPEAEAINAVNTVIIAREYIEGRKDIRLTGHNTDIGGFKKSIKPLLNKNVKSALILGTGGASSAVAEALRQLNVAYIKVSRRHNPECITYSDLDASIMRENLLIVNTTPLGTWPNTELCPDIPYHLLTSSHICHDIVYNPDQTTFMKKSQEFGATVKNGLDMLYQQAELAYKFWNQQ